MATFERTWAFDLNRAYSPASALDLTRYTMWYIAAVLTGNLGGLVSGLWTIRGSSDSSAAGNNDGVDRWVLGGPYDGTKIVRGSGAGAHSWMALTSPSMNGSSWYMVMSFNTSTDAAIRLMWSKTAPTGGTTTATPTATDQWTNISTTAATDWTINAAAADASRLNIGLSSGGDWYFLGCKQTLTRANIFISFMRLSDYHASDAVPIWTHMGYNATSALTDDQGSTCNPWDYATAANGCIMRNFDNTSNTSNASIVAPGTRSGTTEQSLINQASVAHPASTMYSDFPVWITSHNSAAAGRGHYIRGRVPDISQVLHTTGTISHGAASPASAPYDSSRAGDLWLPANAAFNFA